MSIDYLSKERIIELNLLVLTIIKVKKADTHKVGNVSKLIKVLDLCKKSSGDIYDKAIILFKGIINEHPFVSGNRRTAFLATKLFLLTNDSKFGIKDDSSKASIMLGIREGFYSDEEIKELLKNGKIREFRR